MNEQTAREKIVYGSSWNAVHEGYFSDPAVAAPLIGKIREAAEKIRPGRIVDLGGGTGYLLSHLRAAGVEPGAELVNLDVSPDQLAAAPASGLDCVLGSVESFCRGDLEPGEGNCLFVMRSVLHYFGEQGLRPVLRHLRTQAGPGDLFVHQTASFARPADADCLNFIYAAMGTGKWYPTVAGLRQSLRAEGWDVREVLPAPPLRLTSAALAERYGLEAADVRGIRERLSRNPPAPEDVLQLTRSGFVAFLHYWIYVCAPKDKNITPRREENRINREKH